MKELADRAIAAIKRHFCRHLNTVYDPPTLRYTSAGHPEVVSRCYCSDCGKGVPNPFAERDHAEACRLLHEARAKP